MQVTGVRAPLPAAMERRRDTGRGTFFSSEEIEQAVGIRNLLIRARGVSIVGSGRWAVEFARPAGGSCWADVYIDGRYSGPPKTTTDESFGSAARKWEALMSYPPEELYAIEVYPRASEAPSEFVGVRDGCGVIMAWTRAYTEALLAAESRSKTNPTAPQIRR